MKIIKVNDKKTMKKFIHMPWKIYKNDKNWVPPLLIGEKEKFNKNKFPFFEHSEADFFIAEKDGKIVGRIAGIKNNRHLDVYKDDVGFFGFFESIDDQNVANALLDKACNWLKNRGLKYVRGPENYSQNEEVGLLIDAFDSPPVVMMTYNPPYYKKLIENYGFKKEMDLYAYNLENVTHIPARLKRAVHLLKKKYNYRIRKVNLKKLDSEVKKIKTIYDSAWSENWGAVPFTDAEINHIKKELVQILDPDLAYIAEIDGKPVGVGLSIPNINEAIIKTNGRLFPFGLLKLLWHKRKIKSVRVIILGILPNQRHKGIDTALYYETFKNGIKNGYTSGEMSWILENNYPMRNALEKIYGSKIYKTYRIYQRPIA
ncbi:MAG: GNAT family N-acetyltransferase [Candidatus Marinimicrobia bacterium]|nr:GNAT family N-acetyltransferase [Candidatus Neomarinimicrobiota bacterium]